MKRFLVPIIFAILISSFGCATATANNGADSEQGWQKKGSVYGDVLIECFEQNSSYLVGITRGTAQETMRFGTVEGANSYVSKQYEYYNRGDFFEDHLEVDAVLCTGD